MTEQEREELIEKMANAMFASKQYNGCFTLTDMACAALAIAEPVIRERVELELRVKNVCVYGTSHPEIYKTAEDDLREENVKLRAALKRMLLEFDFMVESGVIPDVRNDVIFEDAAAALKETGDDNDNNNHKSRNQNI